MVRVTIDSSGIADLARDCDDVGRGGRTRAERAVKKVAETGNRIASSNARATAGRHGRHYHRAFTAEEKGVLRWEYGPDSARPQGGMSFEHGSRNQPPHLDLAKSADVVSAQLGRKVGDAVEQAFWNG